MSKIVLYMASTVNGYIADQEDGTHWVSNEEWDSYSAFVRGAGNLIIGRRTYEILTKQPEFSEFKDVKLVVVSHNDFHTLAPNHLVSITPQEAIEVLKDFEIITLAGGGNLNTSFLKENLIDEMYLDIEPKVLGRGIKLFEESGVDLDLTFIGSKKINEGCIQLHYKVNK